jgi:cysteine desulfurase
MNKSISKYFDYSATTPVDPRVVKAMEPLWADNFGNPSSFHDVGQEARVSLDKAREKLANLLKVKYEEVIFTSGATESINTAHKGIVEALKGKVDNPKIITTPIEHKAVLESLDHLSARGLAQIEFAKVDSTGTVLLDDLEDRIDNNTVLLSIGLVNNEVGTIQPLPEIGRLVKKANKTRGEKEAQLYFHSDITQAVGHMAFDLGDIGLDMASFSGHKFYAPKGIGVLYIKKGTPFIKQQDGGSQELKKRAGTENMPYIIGITKALEIALSEQDDEIQRLKKFQEKLISQLTELDGVTLSGGIKNRVAHITSFIISGVEGESVLIRLGQEGFQVSTGSACTSGELKPSHVLTSMGIRPEKAHGSLRISLGRWTTQEEVDEFIKVFPEVIGDLRKIGRGLLK